MAGPSHPDLAELQRVDTAIDQAKHRRRTLPERARLEELGAQLAELAARRAPQQAETARLEETQAALEAEIAALEAKRRDVDRKLAVGTVPRELQALSEEAEALRRRQAGLEDQVLAAMEALEPLTVELQEADRIEAELTQERMAVSAALAEATAVVDAEIAELEKGRAAAAAAVAPDRLAEYERLRARLDGVAVAELQGGRCSGCHVQLPSMEAERVRRAGPDELVYCDSCGRLFVKA